jgi:hypothetical protein
MLLFFSIIVVFYGIINNKSIKEFEKDLMKKNNVMYSEDETNYTKNIIKIINKERKQYFKIMKEYKKFKIYLINNEIKQYKEKIEEAEFRKICVHIDESIKGKYVPFDVRRQLSKIVKSMKDYKLLNHFKFFLKNIDENLYKGSKINMKEIDKIVSNGKLFILTNVLLGKRRK